MRILLKNVDLGKYFENHNDSCKNLISKLKINLSFSLPFLEKSGTVKEDAFFTILKLHGMDLPESEKSRLKKSFARAGKINYNDAIQAIQIDLDSAVLNEEKWTVQKGGVGAQAQEA